MGALAFLFAVRWGAWAIALLLVAFGDRPDDNTRYEPLLLGLTFAQALAATLYVPLLRPRLRRAVGLRWGPRDDLIALGLVDMAAVLVVLYFSGGWLSPYYHYAVSSLLVPTFLLGWRRSALLLLTFLAAYVGIMAIAGQGTDGPWLRADVGSLAGILMTPLLVVIVVQYLSWLARRLREQREQARRAFHETAALYHIAQTVVASDDPAELMASVVDTLKGTERFRALAVLSLGADGALSPQARFGYGAGAFPGLRLSEALVEALAQPEGLLELKVAGETTETTFVVPVLVQGQPWGAVAFRSEGRRPPQADPRFVRAVGGQLSLGLTKIALQHQKEELAALEERSRIAREIHDGIAQSIYMLTLNLEKAAEVASDDPKLGERLHRLVVLAKETLLEVRHYIFDLKPLLAGETGLASAIQGQVREFSTVSGLPVQLEVEGQERRVSLSVGSSLYRIAQEALANVYRHADASAIQVRLAFAEDAVSLEVRDDGCGFAIDADRPESLRGRGLRNIRQRAGELGGEADIASAPGRGTTVRVKVPLGR